MRLLLSAIFSLLLWLSLVGFPCAVVAQTAVGDLADLACADLTEVFFAETPQRIYTDQPDELYGLVLAVAERCDPGEPLIRIQILASIWDGNFQEEIYGDNIIGSLIQRYDSRSYAAAGTAHADFDTFTTFFADQMLPHTTPGSLEQFFCLYYAGRTAAAWALLQGAALEQTWLRYYYDEAVHLLNQQRNSYTVVAQGGTWTPRGELGLVGPKTLMGVTIEQRWSAWLGRAALAWRLGRSQEPYWVDKGGVSGFSNRWDAVMVSLEGGRSLIRTSRHLVAGFLGIGLDSVRPFRDEDINLTALNLSAGLGYRWRGGRSGRWFVGLDGRYEFQGHRNLGGTDLSGRSWSAGLSLGFALAPDPRSQLRALGR